MEPPVPITLPRTTRGDAYVAIAIGPIIVNNATPPGNLIRVVMTFRAPNGTHYLIDSNPAANPDHPATITDAANWEATIPPITNFLPLAATWEWQLHLTSDDAQLGRRTFYEGTITVLPSIPKAPVS